MIKGAPRTADVFIGNCDLDVDVESLTKYITEDIGIDILGCSPIQTRSTRCKCFKVKLNLNVRDKVLSPEVWPEDVICRKFYNPRTYNNNG